MNVESIAMTRAEARDLYRKYKTHQHYQSDLDREVQRTYQLIAQGKVIIQALEAVKRAGLDAKGLPKLALGGAMDKFCYIERRANGGMSMWSGSDEWRDRRRKAKWLHNYRAETFEFAQNDFPSINLGSAERPIIRRQPTTHKSAVPAIPIHLRPKRGLQNYHVLWEAEWEPVPTRDPYLLRRIGKADLWLVCAAWDLTEVERAAMATRIAGN